MTGIDNVFNIIPLEFFFQYFKAFLTEKCGWNFFNHF